MENKIRRMSLLEIKFILKLLNAPNHRGFAESSKDGGFIVHLQKEEIIVPAGKVDRKIRWELRTKFTIEQINLMKSLAED